MAAASYSRSLDIDSGILIELVKARPALYDRTCKAYRNQDTKVELWKEIASILFSDSWDQMTQVAKDNKASEVLKRWNNIRTAFARELKLMRDPNVCRSKKYVYFDKLLFLLEFTNDHALEETEKVESDEKNTDNIKRKSVSRDFISEPPPLIAFEQHDKDKDKEKVDSDHENNTEKKKRKSVSKVIYKTVDNEGRRKKKEKRDRQDIGNFVDYSIKLKGIKQASEFDLDGDTNFALSLVPSLKNIPLDKKIDAQIEILSVLKKYSVRENDLSGYTLVKYESADPLTSEGEEIEILSGDDDDNNDN